MATCNLPLWRALIVDDDPIVASTLATSLERLLEKFTVDTAHSFAEALSQIQQNPYALLIADYKMPGLNGLDLAQAVQRISPDTQIILITGCDNQQLRDTVALLGLSGYLEKPFTLAQFRELLLPIAAEATALRRVLLLEDKDFMRRIYRESLQRAGYRVHEARSLQTAHDLLSYHRFDAFLCALEINNKRTVDWLREHVAQFSQTGTHTIVISSQRGYRTICEGMGIEFYMETPIATDTLITLLDRLTVKESL